MCLYLRTTRKSPTAYIQSELPYRKNTVLSAAFLLTHFSLPVLLTHPPGFIPSEKFTEEHMEKMNINATSFLWLEEEKPVLFLIKVQEAGIAWDASERGNFRKDYFDPIVIPTIEHIPWVERNIPILPGIHDEVIRILKEKIRVSVYERSNSSYWSKWFCVLKKDGKSLRLVHDLQPLNVMSGSCAT